MNAALAILLGGVVATAPHPWTPAHARQVLTARTYEVADTTQADQPVYDLTFSRRAAKSLDRKFVFNGRAHDTLTDLDVPVRFTFVRPGSVFPYSRFHPSLDSYSGADPRVIRAHTDAMRYAHLQAGIYSWWGPDAYLRVNGRFVVFVYGNRDDSCATAARWREADTVGAYLVLKAFEGFRQCSAQPDAWHQYSAALPEYDLAPDALMIAPGFDETREQAPRLTRDLTRWRSDVTAMLASHADWQLVLSFNEWPEGTSVESADEWATGSGYGAYLDALHELLPG